MYILYGGPCYIITSWKCTFIPEVRPGVYCYSNKAHHLNGGGIFACDLVGGMMSMGHSNEALAAVEYFIIS